MAVVDTDIRTNGAGDYQTITLWIDDDYGSVDLLNDDCTGSCYWDGTAFDESPTIDVVAKSIALTVPEAERHDGTAGTGARIVRTGGATVFTVTPTVVVTIEWLEVDGPNAPTGAAYQIYEVGGVGTTLVVHHCLLHDLGPDSDGKASIYCIRSSPGVVHNNVIYDIDITGIAGHERFVYGIKATHTAEIEAYNNTVWHVTMNDGGATAQCYGILLLDAVGDVLKNNLIMDCVDGGLAEDGDYWDASPANAVTATNGSSDATSPDGAAYRNWAAADQFVSTEGGSEDLHLKAGADAIDEGTDLEETPTGVNFDIDNFDRHAEGVVWDIGADEYVAAAVGAIIKQINSQGVDLGADLFNGTLIA